MTRRIAGMLARLLKKEKPAAEYEAYARAQVRTWFPLSSAQCLRVCYSVDCAHVLRCFLQNDRAWRLVERAGLFRK